MTEPFKYRVYSAPVNETTGRVVASEAVTQGVFRTYDKAGTKLERLYLEERHKCPRKTHWIKPL